MFSMPLLPGENRGEHLGEFKGRSVKNRYSQGFSPAREFSQTLPRFSQGNGGMKNMFYFFYKIIIFRLKKEKDDIQNARIVLFLS